MDIKEAVKFLDNETGNPQNGLSDEVFYFVSRMTPLVNVDLLIKDEKGRVLLSWRDDEHSGKGWHLPGGIIRVKETLEDRLQKVAINEIGVNVEFDPEPLTFRQIIHPERKNRCHFISFLYNCSLSGDFVPDNKELNEKSPGYLKWHENCPLDLLDCHKPYKKYIER